MRMTVILLSGSDINNILSRTILKVCAETNSASGEDSPGGQPGLANTTMDLSCQVWLY